MQDVDAGGKTREPASLKTATEHLTAAREPLKAIRRSIAAVRCSLAALRCSLAALRLAGSRAFSLNGCRRRYRGVYIFL